MATQHRSFEQGKHFHIYGRGHGKDNIFRDNVDRKQFLSSLDRFCERDRILLLAYCLMDNHYHLAVRIDGKVSLSRTMRSILSGFSHRYNTKYGTVGSLFQGEFQHREVTDEMDMANLTRYIHLNPHPFKDFRKYRWSNYQEYAGKRSGICEPGPVLDTFGGSKLSYAIFMEKAVSRRENKTHALQI